MELGIKIFPSSSSNPSAIYISEVGYVFVMRVWKQAGQNEDSVSVFINVLYRGLFDK